MNFSIVRHGAWWVALALGCTLSGSAQSGSGDGPLMYAALPGPRPAQAQLAELRARNAELTALIHEAERPETVDRWTDVAIYRQAVDYILRFPEQFYSRPYYQNALNLVAAGMRRGAELKQGGSSWTTGRGAIARGYVSAVDGSVQPYAVWVPANYDPGHPARLDVILHGRSRVLNEVSFLTSVANGKIVATETGRKTDPDCLKLYVFGRGNTSYRWVGESDVFEALASVRSRYKIDENQIVLRGFSMGGTGAWHLGLHFPSRWAAVEAGAGYVQTRPEVLRTVTDAWRLQSLAIHDASNCAVNLTNLPWVAYYGSLDPIGADTRTIRRDLEAEHYQVDALPRARFLVGEGFGHNFRPESKKQSDAFIDASLPRRQPASFRFVTYTPAYGEFWDFHVDSLERLYQRAELTGTPDRVRTSNIWVLKLDRPRTLSIDGQTLSGDQFCKEDKAWRVGAPSGLRKRAGLQGPIDDAFQQPFLCVGPATGVDPVLEKFRSDFARYFHGQVRTKAPSAVTASDIARYNLILFGTPSTNPLIRRVLSGLPVTWTASAIGVGGRSYPAADNTVALIYPNPLNLEHYVVLNSGHTFPGNDVDNMHWFLHPRLGDFAVLNQKTRAVQAAGFFDRNWKFGSDQN